MHTLPLFLAGVLGLGGPELVVIFAIFMLLFGGSKLPELAKGLGKSIKEFKQASREDDDQPATVQKSPEPVVTLSEKAHPAEKTVS
jgi:sec-independent protein translocase protein TatA